MNIDNTIPQYRDRLFLHCIQMNMYITGLFVELFVQKLMEAYNKEAIKVSHF